MTPEGDARGGDAPLPEDSGLDKPELAEPGPDTWVERYLERREAGELLPFEEFLEEVPAAERAEVSRIYASVREVLGSLAPAPQEDRREWRYEDRGILGRGGNADVRVVFDHRLDRELAMKLVRADEDLTANASSQADGDDGARALERRRRVRFVAEAKLAGRLEHPGILAVHDLGRTPDGRDFFTMPRLEGQTLHELIARLHSEGPKDSTERDPWGLPRLLDVLVRVAEAVAFAHARGVVHRDIKPANIMVGSFGETYLLDWGLAGEEGTPEGRASAPEASGRSAPSAIRPGDAALTGAGDVVGTPAYMAPEQAMRGARDVDRRADVYALGACLHELLAGEPPYGRDLDALATLRALHAGPPQDIHRAHPATPPELAAVVRRAIARNLDERYPSAEEFASDLRAFSEGRVVRAYESGGLAELKKWIGRNRGLAVAMIATLLAVVGGVVAALLVRAGERADSLRFLDLQLVEESRAAVADLWERGPEREAGLDRWLGGARDLVDRLELHRSELAVLDERAAQLEQRPASRGGWTFADRDLRWRHENLSELVVQLEAFAAEGGGLDVVRSGRERLVESWPRALSKDQRLWSAVREVAGADAPYSGLDFSAEPGLRPLGTDPASGLLEFAVLGTGEIPSAGAKPSAGDAIVLLLVPGGEALVGVGEDHSAPTTGFELPGQRVVLDPFLLGKSELTRAQWSRLVHAPEAPRNPDLPQTDLSYSEVIEVLGRWELGLPFEAQWEHAAELAVAGLPLSLREDPEWAAAQLAPLLPAGGRPSDALGLYNLLGNVAELCADPLLGSATFEAGSGRPIPTDGVVYGEYGVVKGGHSRLSAYDRPESLPAFVQPEARLTGRRDERSERYGVRVCKRPGTGASTRK